MKIDKKGYLKVIWIKVKLYTKVPRYVFTKKLACEWNKSCYTKREHFISDVDPHWSYADPDPQNLMIVDPDPGLQKSPIDFKSKVEKKIF